MKLYLTTACFMLGRQLGEKKGLAEIERQYREAKADSLPVARTVKRFAQIAEVGIYTDCSAALIGTMRSRAFHKARRACENDGFEAWVSLDDDIEITVETAVRLVHALDDIVPRIIFLPYPLRPNKDNEAHLSCNFPIVRIERELPSPWDRPTRLLQMPQGWGGGFGCVGMNSRAILEVAQACPDSLSWNDDDGEIKLALFHAIIRDGRWFGEDTSFFLRVPPTISVEAMLSGYVNHAGIGLDLAAL